MRPIVRRAASFAGLSDAQVRAAATAYRAALPRRGLREHHRVPLWHEDVPFVLVTSQKAGSTAALLWFLVHAGLAEEAARHPGFVHDFEQKVLLSAPGYVAGLRRALRDRPVLKVWREPGARALSSYMMLNTRAAFAREPAGWPGLRARVFRACGVTPAPEARLPFRAFLGWLARADHVRLDGHFARQANAYDVALPSRPEALRIEEASRWMPAIEDRFGLGHPPVQAAPPHHLVRGGALTLEEIVERGVPAPGTLSVPPADGAALAAFGLGPDLLAAFGPDYAGGGYEAPA